MAVLTYTEITDYVKDALVANVTTDAPISSTEMLRAVNAAYSEVWEISGGSMKSVGSPTAWQSAQTATGLVFGLLTDINRILDVYASSTAPSALTTVTAASTTLTSAALFGSITRGMHITGTGIPANTYVISVESTSSLTMSQAATDSTSNTRTFSDTGEVSGTKQMQPVEFEEVQFWKKSDITGTYDKPKIYAATRLEAGSPLTATASDVGKHRLDYYPAVTGFYFPISYLPQFTPMDGGASDVPSVNDLESYDIAWMAALDLCPREGRAELAPALALKVSAGTAKAFERKLKALLSADQDREATWQPS